VAEHSVHVSLLCRPENRLAGLLHDASEAYICDLSRPVKMLTPVGAPYYTVENTIMCAIANRFGFAWPPHKEVKAADNIMVLTEKDQLMANLSWDTDASSEEARAMGRALDHTEMMLAGYLPRVAERIFMERFDELTQDLGNL
jgi:5'-deoxynucleotidase YfbR-like HD superfamily hydrolase